MGPVSGPARAGLRRKVNFMKVGMQPPTTPKGTPREQAFQKAGMDSTGAGPAFETADAEAGSGKPGKAPEQAAAWNAAGRRRGAYERASSAGQAARFNSCGFFVLIAIAVFSGCSLIARDKDFFERNVTAGYIFANTLVVRTVSYSIRAGWESICYRFTSVAGDSDNYPDFICVKNEDVNDHFAGFGFESFNDTELLAAMSFWGLVVSTALASIIVLAEVASLGSRGGKLAALSSSALMTMVLPLLVGLYLVCVTVISWPVIFTQWIQSANSGIDTLLFRWAASFTVIVAFFWLAYPCAAGRGI